MNIQDMLLTLGTGRARPGVKIAPQGIVVHYVGNPSSSAKANRDWFESLRSPGLSSANFIIGLNGEILRCIPEDEKSYHAGKAYGAKWATQAPKNNGMYIGIECCHPDAGGKFNAATYAALVELCAHLCAKCGFDPEKDIFRHYDVAGKMCPLWHVNHPSDWRGLLVDIKSMVEGRGAMPNQTPIMAKPYISPQQMEDWAAGMGAAAFWAGLAGDFYEIAAQAGVDPAVAYCQSAVETGYGRFGGVVPESFNNTCGMKTTRGGPDEDPASYMRFRDWREGIQAQVDHLALYAGVNGYPKSETPDPRHFSSCFGQATTVEGLSGKWAGDSRYCAKITALIDGLKAFPVTPSTLQSATHEAGDWAKTAWAWAIGAGITDGTRPLDMATRQEVVAMIWNAFFIMVNHKPGA